MPADDYTIREVDDALVIRLDADNLLGVMDVTRIGNALNERVKSDKRHVVLDLAKVRYAGSAALGMLVSLSKTLQARQGRLVLTGTQHLETLFKVSRTMAVFDIAKDTDAALASLSR
jgi:anti-anti-sigma factor